MNKARGTRSYCGIAPAGKDCKLYNLGQASPFTLHCRTRAEDAMAGHA